MQHSENQNQGNGNSNQQTVAGASQVFKLTSIFHKVTRTKLKVSIQELLYIRYNRFQIPTSNVHTHHHTAPGVVTRDFGWPF
ncbi:hypothetical protein DSECCO2_605920 [anaerobic digester metagenome]